MFKIPLILLHLILLQGSNFGLASVYNDKIFACPKSTYINSSLPVCANRVLPCGSVVVVERIDKHIRAQCVIGDRGPFGACVYAPGKKTRACGTDAKWVNGSKFLKAGMSINSIRWRGILDMTPELAKRLKVKNRLVPVLIWLKNANKHISNVIPNNIKNLKLFKKVKKFNILSYLEHQNNYDSYTKTGQAKNK